MISNLICNVSAARELFSKHEKEKKINYRKVVNCVSKNIFDILNKISSVTERSMGNL